MSTRPVLCLSLLLALLTSAALAADLPAGWTVAPGNDKQPGQAGYRIWHRASGVELVYVPAGEFTMGSDAQDAAYARQRLGATAEVLEDEFPAHEVSLSAYWIGRTEVTYGQWRAAMGQVPEAALKAAAGGKTADRYPVVGLTYAEVVSFCEKLGLRLPTEAQWEYAARGPAELRFAWGNEWDGSKCVNGSNRGREGRAAPVGSLPQGMSWCGALDLAGNVWEYCGDWYAPNYYAASPSQDPPGPSEAEAPELKIPAGEGQELLIGKTRVARGGSWRHDYRYVYRAAFRRAQPPLQRNPAVGFRVALQP